MADYPTLPIGFPYGIKPNSYGTLRTKMEQGYVQTRAKVTRTPRHWRLMHIFITAAERTSWLNHWNTYKGGSNTFTFHDPDSNQDILVRFAMDEPEVIWVSPGRYTIANIELEEAL